MGNESVFLNKAVLGREATPAMDRGKMLSIYFSGGKTNVFFLFLMASFQAGWFMQEIAQINTGTAGIILFASSSDTF
ncbi:hypothetical protein EGT74_01500 [Chitinophaga lutea]|uniref:Uncharacterized protein n=1 Tax=Chitinophaga lutea TaxID=2488634 RepID=A0A3N4PZC5_9BACT|nr:hypothetical protein EGT74_01500 [Chitinophaga lutea]